MKPHARATETFTEGCCSQGLNRGKEESVVLLTNSEPRTRTDGEETLKHRNRPQGQGILELSARHKQTAHLETLPIGHQLGLP